MKDTVPRGEERYSDRMCRFDLSLTDTRCEDVGTRNKQNPDFYRSLIRIAKKKKNSRHSGGCASRG